MPDLTQLVDMAPSVVVVIVFTFFFLRYVREERIFRERMSDSCHASHLECHESHQKNLAVMDKVQQDSNEAIKRNSETLSTHAECTREMKVVLEQVRRQLIKMNGDQQNGR